jgi:hypothetical protein
MSLLRKHYSDASVGEKEVLLLPTARLVLKNRDKLVTTPVTCGLLRLFRLCNGFMM